MLNQLINAVLQVLAFTAVPFLVYLAVKKSPRGFLSSIGLRKTTTRAALLSPLVSLAIAVPILSLTAINEDFYAAMTNPSSVTGAVRAMGPGVATIVIIVIIAVIKTALAEEIFFRGFVAKWLIRWLGFKAGALIQAVIFGAIHTLLFLTISSDPLFLAVTFIFPALGGYLMVCINERLGQGSIIPGWIAHAVANLLAYSVVAFVI